MGLILKASLACRRAKEVCSRVPVDMIDRGEMDCGRAFRGDTRPRPWAPKGRRPVLETAWASLVVYLMRTRRT